MKAVRPSNIRKCSGTEAGSKPGGASIAIAEQLNSIATTSINERIVRTFQFCRMMAGNRPARPDHRQTRAILFFRAALAAPT